MKPTLTLGHRIIRIVFTVPVFAIVSFLSIVFEDAAIYLYPIENLYEAFAFVSLFMLLAEFVHEDDYARESFFANKGKNYTVSSYHYITTTFYITNINYRQ